MKNKLTISDLIQCANEFCKQENGTLRDELFGVTDGKAIGTIVEHLFKDYLAERYDLTVGSSAKGLDLPSVNTDIKVTSMRQPQSSCPYKESKQKIYGLGYNLLVFGYEKKDDTIRKKGMLQFVSCTFIDSMRTADYQMTTGLLSIINNNGNSEDIFSFLTAHQIPGDEITLNNLAEEILQNPPQIGYLTISNALQWRLQYKRIMFMDGEIEGITPIVKYDGK